MNSWLVTNLWKKRTGLPMLVYASAEGYLKHGPIIRVQRDHGDKFSGKTFSITIPGKKIIGNVGDISEADLEKVFKFIDNNIDNLLKLWEGEFDSSDFCKAMIPNSEYIPDQKL